MADNVRMGAGGVPYKVQSEPKEEVISEVLTVNPNKTKEEKKSKATVDQLRRDLKRRGPLARRIPKIQ